MSRAFTITIVLLLCSMPPSAFPRESSRGYGSRINLSPDAIVTADFIDRDGDNIDDRYQRGPGQPPINKKRLLLPQIHYIGIPNTPSIADIRDAIAIREGFENYKQKIPSLLQLSEQERELDLNEAINSKRIKAKVYDFPGGLRITRMLESKKIAIGSIHHNNYEYFKEKTPQS
jgi:hypothetical protein